MCVVVPAQNKSQDGRPEKERRAIQKIELWKHQRGKFSRVSPTPPTDERHKQQAKGLRKVRGYKHGSELSCFTFPANMTPLLLCCVFLLLPVHSRSSLRCVFRERGPGVSKVAAATGFKGCALKTSENSFQSFEAQPLPLVNTYHDTQLMTHLLIN